MKDTIDSNQTLDGNITAKPKTNTDARNFTAGVDAGHMNLKDAKELGYTDNKGHAISKAKTDVKGSPTGAYTHIGAGRSSVVRHR